MKKSEVGRTPWSAAGPLAGLPRGSKQRRDGGVPRGPGGPPYEILRNGILLALALLLGGCMVGPKYKTPTAAVPPAFKEGPPASFKEGDGWKTAQPGDQTIR